MRALVIATSLIALVACDHQSQPRDLAPGTPVTVAAPDSQEAAALRAEIDATVDWSVADLLAAYPTAETVALDFEPLDAAHLDLIAASSFALDDDERARVELDGFAITDDIFPSFVYGYATIYAEDLPLFVSADSILFALHRSYDAILRDIERQALAGSLESLIDRLRRRLLDGHALGLTAEQETDLDLYLAVAGTLLSDAPRPTLVGASQPHADGLVARAIAADGAEMVDLFGSERRIDWSQFAPRGHYAGDEQLERYFRAMMWLGRIDFRMLEPNDRNQLEFRRRQFNDTLALWKLFDDAAWAEFTQIHETIGAFVGEPDGFVVSQVPALLEALGVETVTETKTLSDDEVAATLQKHRFGAQRIASHYMVNGIAGTTKPLAYSSALMGQRYVLDAHVFANVVYDRAGGGTVKRMMPNPLDVAFAALANNRAAPLLAPDLEEHGYQHDLASMRVLADAHGEDYWSANLYNLWLAALRTLSADDATTTPTVARTDAWGRRLLNTQLASWAELRHDTILYAKQSFTAGAACEYPDAYVEPNPAFFAQLEALAEVGARATVGFGPQFGDYFTALGAAAARLRAMAEAQASGAPHSADDIAWINDAVAPELNCDDTLLGATGWYSRLFYDRGEMNFDPTIADVHTQPTDAAGNEVGRVLHVGTGFARGLVVTVNTCEGPRAYVGLASTYHEVVTDDFDRLNDRDWAPIVSAGDAPAPAWLP